MTPRLPYAQQRTQSMRNQQQRRDCETCAFGSGKPGPEDVARANAYLSRLGVPAEVLEVRA